MEFDYTRLRERIIEKCGSQAKFAKRMGLSTSSVSQKLNNKKAWVQAELLKVAEILEFSPAELHIYFFTIKGDAITQIRR